MEGLSLIFKLIAIGYVIFYAFTVWGAIVVRKYEKELSVFFKNALIERPVGLILAIGILIYI